ncbi:MarR family transcriptional regulator [Nonomuraea monospora]|uniref:MarR family transcriptional regulator n=1 Tax=Nonomuraea monospora TaxID=568818 RepID=A0ABN3CW77_9ACTN
MAVDDDAEDLDAVITAVLAGSRLLISVAARSLAAVEDKITLPQFRMLVLLAGHGGVNLVTMAELLDVNSSTAMRMADRLGGAGLIVREVNPDNRRESMMRLTKEGHRIVDEVMARRRKQIGEIVSRLSATQRQALISAMNAFNEAGGESAASLPQWPGV